MLENHILALTHTVKQLTADIQVLQRQISQRDSVTSINTLAVQSIDKKSMVAIGDLRGRVARYDGSIAKLSNDANFLERRLFRLQQEVTGLVSSVDVRFKELEVKLYRDLDRLEASLTEQAKGQRNFMSEMQRQISTLELRSSAQVKETQQQTDAMRKWTEQQLLSSAENNAQSSQQLRTQMQDEMFEAESRSSSRLRALEARVGQLEHGWDDRLRSADKKHGKRMSSMEESLHQKLQLLKQEYHKGFLSVLGAIESLREISDIKSCLDKEKLQKDIKHIYRMLAEFNDA